MAILKRRPSQDAEGLKRQQPHAVASELENTQSNPPANLNTTATTAAVQGSATKAVQPVFGLDDLASSGKLSSPAAFTHILDVAQPVEPNLRGEEDHPTVASTPAPTPSSSPSSQFRTSRPPGKMTSRPPEQEFGNIRALSRFLRATGPLDLDEAHLGHAFSSQSFSAQPPPVHDRPFLSMSLNSVPPSSSISHAPVSSSDYFKALDARLDQYDQDINVDTEDSSPPPLPAKSIRKSRSIGESFALKARARSHSSGTRLESTGTTLSPPILPPSPALPHTLAVPLHNPAPTSPSQSSTGNKLKGFGGLATILRRKKSGPTTTATAGGTSRKGNGHNRRAGIGSDDFFVPTSGDLPSDLSAPSSKASPFSFRRYAAQATDTPLPPIFRSPARKGSSTPPGRVTEIDTTNGHSHSSDVETSNPVHPQSSPILTPPSSSPSSASSHKQKRVPVPKYDSQTNPSLANGANSMNPSLILHSAQNQSTFVDFAGYDYDGRSDDGKEGDERVEKISIDGDLGEFRPSPGPEELCFSASPSTGSQSSPTSTGAESGVGADSASNSTSSAHSSLEQKKSSESERRLLQTPILITEPTPRPSTTSSGSNRTAAAVVATNRLSLHRPTGSPKKEKSSNGLHPFPMVGSASGTGGMTPPLSPPPDMPLPLPPRSTSRPNLSLVGALRSSTSQSSLSLSRLLTPSTISSLPSTSTSIVTSSLSDALVPADIVSRHASAASLSPPPPSSFGRLRARTLSPAKRPSTHLPYPPVQGSLSATSSSSTVVLHSTIIQLETALAATNARVEKMTEVTTTVMEALRDTEAREALLLERVERLERVLSNSTLRSSVRRSLTSRDGIRAIEGPLLRGEAGGSGSSCGSSGTAMADRAAALATAIQPRDSSPPTARGLRRRRTLSSEIFPAGLLTSIDVGFIRSISSNASEDGHSTGTHLRNRVTRRKSLRRSRSRSGTGSSRDRRLNPPHLSTTVVPPPSAASVAETFYSARGGPSPITDARVEVEFERRGTMSLLTSTQPRRKRALPLLITTANKTSTDTPAINEDTMPVKARPVFSLQYIQNSDSAASTDAWTSLVPPASTIRAPRFPENTSHGSERGSMASSLVAVDNNHLDPYLTHRSSATFHSLIVPSGFSHSGSGSNSASNSPSVTGPPSPSFEQLVDLLEDLAAKTPSSSPGTHDSEETEGNRVSSIVVPALD